jgi:hypothetical protein
METKTRPYKTRATLINKNGKDLITKLRESYTDIDWYLTVKDGREVCVGVKGGKILIIGATYETIEDNLKLIKR